MTTRINGRMFSWSSVSIRINGTLISAIKSIAYSDKIEPVKGYGSNRSFRPIGKTQGKYSTDPVTASIEVAELEDLRQALADASGTNSFGNVEFQIVVQYEEPGRGVYTDVIEGCTWTKTAAKADDGGDAIYLDVEFDCMAIKWNGKYKFEEQNAS